MWKTGLDSFYGIKPQKTQQSYLILSFELAEVDMLGLQAVQISRCTLKAVWSGGGIINR